MVSNYVKLGPEKSSAGEADADNKVALILTDARCLPCSEGAPVVDEAGLLLGLVRAGCYFLVFVGLFSFSFD
eukprot:SAG31_NODE_2050_length_6560_cov_2.712119_5_plen_72_part_00